MHPTQQPATDTTGAVELDLTPADVLRGAALYVRRHGLHQGDMFANPKPSGETVPRPSAMPSLRMYIQKRMRSAIQLASAP